MYLFDTNIISVLAPEVDRRTQEKAINDWLVKVAEQLFISVVSIAEMEAGIARAKRNGASVKADRLATWLSALKHLYGQRILPLDLTAAEITGRLLDKARGLGTTPGFEDAAIAATAVRHDLTVVTRNIKHFEIFDIRLFNPYTGAP